MWSRYQMIPRASESEDLKIFVTLVLLQYLFSVHMEAKEDVEKKLAGIFSHFNIHFQELHIKSCIFSSADPKVSSAELMVLLICPSSVVVRPSTFALNRYSSYSSYSIILNFLLEKLGI